MSALANWLSRLTWFYILHWMRKPWMRRAQLFPMLWMRGARKDRYYANFVKQNRLARRIGLKLLLVAYTMMLASLILQIAFQAIMSANERGWLSPPSLENRRDEISGTN